MITRTIEQPLDIIRKSVKSAAVKNIGETFVEFETTAVLESKKILSSADLDFTEKKAVGDDIKGILRIDLVADTVFRVRYSEKKLPADTSIMIDTLSAASADIVQDNGKVIINTGKMEVIIDLDKTKITAKTACGKYSFAAGGPEKNYFYNWDTINTGICTTKDRRSIAVENFDLPASTAIYGLGEKFIKLDKSGQTIDLDMIDALGVTTPRTYKNIPFFLTTSGYGVFMHHSSLMTVWCGSRSICDVQIAIEDDYLDYFVFLGDIKDILTSYTNLTGKGSLPPKWSFGYWQSKISYWSAEETIDIAKKMRENSIPCDVIHLDTFWFERDWYCNLTFSDERFPDPTAYLKELKDLGIKVSLWQLPYVPEGNPYFEDLKSVDGFVKTKDGGIYDCQICFTPEFKGIVGVIDFTNPKAVDVYKKWLKKLFALGAKVIKTDFGESAPLDGVYYDGTPGHKMHNLYPLLYNKAAFEATKEGTGDGLVWGRSSWAGGQKYPLQWGGDNSPNYDNLMPQLSGGLSFGLSGFQFWSQDIGGFLGNTSDELLVRWMQMGLFLSHGRIHGSGDRELYKFTPETVKICRKYLNLRYGLMPYIYGEAKNCVEKSLPFARPLVVEYQSDKNTYGIYDEYLFGSDMLIAPIYTEDGIRDIYLPEGNWQDWWTKETINGKKWITVKTDLETMPIYIREGGVVAESEVLQYIGEKEISELTITINPFTTDGENRKIINFNDEFITAVYIAKGGAHTLKLSKDIKVTIKSTADIKLI